MAVTSTASTAVSSQQPRIPRGAEQITRVQTYTQAYAVSPTLSSGDVIIFSDLKIPHGSLITDIEVVGRVQFDGASVQILEAGVHGGTADLFGSATAVGTFSRLNFVNGAVLPYRVSVSDSATTRYIVPTLRADGNPTSPTQSYTLTMIVRYIQDT
jgi:hypothetical protein